MFNVMHQNQPFVGAAVAVSDAGECGVLSLGLGWGGLLDLETEDLSPLPLFSHTWMLTKMDEQVAIVFPADLIEGF